MNWFALGSFHDILNGIAFDYMLAVVMIIYARRCLRSRLHVTKNVGVAHHSIVELDDSSSWNSDLSIKQVPIRSAWRNSLGRDLLRLHQERSVTCSSVGGHCCGFDNDIHCQDNCAGDISIPSSHCTDKGLLTDTEKPSSSVSDIIREETRTCQVSDEIAR